MLDSFFQYLKKKGVGGRAGEKHKQLPLKFLLQKLPLRSQKQKVPLVFQCSLPSPCKGTAFESRQLSAGRFNTGLRVMREATEMGIS